MNPTPILFISDSPSCSSGLGRITRDLALRLHQNCSDIFRVATLGYGGPGSRSLPFQQYQIEGMTDWFIPTIKQVWDDWAGNEDGVIFTIWDPSRMLWFAQPHHCSNSIIREWLTKHPFQKWGYIPIDAYGPNKGLSRMLYECLLGYDRLIAYTDWASGIIGRTLGKDDSHSKALEAIPHGIDTSIFNTSQNRTKCRRIFNDIFGCKGPEILKEDILIGIVATNQVRKDYGFIFQVLADLRKEGLPIRIFINTDALERFWSLPILGYDYNLLDRVIVNVNEVSDETMAMIYSACDVTLGIGLGEGFGFPIFESLACGTPCVTGSYGGQAEFMPKEMLVEPEMYRLEGIHSNFRPVYTRNSWVKTIKDVLKNSRNGRLKTKLPDRLDWNNLWKEWETYFRAAHQSLHQKEEIPDQTSSMNEKDTAKSDSRIVSFASREDQKKTEGAQSSEGQGL